jgi:hypothetical protein
MIKDLRYIFNHSRLVLKAIDESVHFHSFRNERTPGDQDRMTSAVASRNAISDCAVRPSAGIPAQSEAISFKSSLLSLASFFRDLFEQLTVPDSCFQG